MLANWITTAISGQMLVAELRTNLPAQWTYLIADIRFYTRVDIPVAHKRRTIGVVFIISCNNEWLFVKSVSRLYGSCYIDGYNTISTRKYFIIHAYRRRYLVITVAQHNRNGIVLYIMCRRSQQICFGVCALLHIGCR